MYSIDITKIEIYSAVRGDDGLIAREIRVEVEPSALLYDVA